MSNVIVRRLAQGAVQRFEEAAQEQQHQRLLDYDPNVEAAFLLSDLRDEPVDPLFRTLPDWIQAELLRFEMGVEAAQRAGVWQWHRNPPVLNHFAYALMQLLSWVRAQPKNVSNAGVSLPDAAEWEQIDWASAHQTGIWKVRFPLDTADHERYVEWRQSRDAPAKTTAKKRR